MLNPTPALQRPRVGLWANGVGLRLLPLLHPVEVAQETYHWHYCDPCIERRASRMSFTGSTVKPL